MALRKKTIEKIRAVLLECKNSGISINKACEKLEVNNIYPQIKQLIKEAESGIAELQEIVNLYNEVTGVIPFEEFNSILDTDNHIEASYERDGDNKIVYYRYRIYKKNKPALDGRLTREEMAKIMRMYTYEGGGFTAKVVSREFPQFSVQDMKRIFKAFAIYKDNCPFAPHDIEEKSIEELRDIQLREKENDFMRKAEEERIKNNEKLLRKYANENIELKKQLDTLSNVNINIENIEPYEITLGDETIDGALNIYLSDIHLGASLESGALYNENNNYGFEEAKRRLSQFIDKISNLGSFDTVNICLMGDNIDCCGHFGKTARLDHDMPENMDPREQFNKFIELYDWFIRTIDINCIANTKINVYSVPFGNHAGNYEYALNTALKYYTQARFPDINFTLFDQFFGIFEQNGIKFVLTHGKDARFMKNGLPLNIDDKNKVKIYEWLDDNKLYGDNIHIIKGDLHSNNLNSCKRFTYRNVLSLFGASDYSAYNFSRNSYGVSYDVIYNNNVLSGTVENV